MRIALEIALLLMAVYAWGSNDEKIVPDPAHVVKTCGHLSGTMVAKLDGRLE